MTDWTDRAACRRLVRYCDVPGCRHEDCIERESYRRLDSYFFAGEPARIAVATSICRSCSVWEECLRDAFLAGHTWRNGVRGGLDGSERAELRLSQATDKARQERDEKGTGMTAWAEAVRLAAGPLTAEAIRWDSEQEEEAII